MYKRYSKRVFDFFLSLILIVITLPILFTFTIFLFFYHNHRPFFIQSRPGLNSKIFKLIKFRTMRDLTDEQGVQLPDKYRMTKIGSLIRSTSIDELPQLLNVLKGDMSLIGPRPLLVRYLPLYNDFQKRRHEVRPGITGWTQVNGRNSLSWDEKFKLDVWYVDNISFMLDLKILWLTFVKVLKREGVNAADATTMKPFTGNN